ncbi:hypothetical protein YC2023_045704 [Brassica napus]
MEKTRNTRKVYGQWKKTRSSWIMSELTAKAIGTASPRRQIRFFEYAVTNNYTHLWIICIDTPVIHSLYYTIIYRLHIDQHIKSGYMRYTHAGYIGPASISINSWSLIAKRVPGRTDNQVKNYWNTHLSKKLGLGDHSYEAKPACDTETPASLVITTTKTSSPPSLVVTTITSHQDVGDEKVSTIRFDTTDDDSKLNTKSKPVYSIQPDVEVAATIPNLFDTFWVLEDNFDLSSLTMMDFANGDLPLEFFQPTLYPCMIFKHKPWNEVFSG